MANEFLFMYIVLFNNLSSNFVFDRIFLGCLGGRLHPDWFRCCHRIEPFNFEYAPEERLEES